MKKVYKKLTEDQKKLGVIFSSTLSKFRTEQSEDTTHEVTEDNINNTSGPKNKIELLKDDKFFNNSHWNYNIIRE